MSSRRAPEARPVPHDDADAGWFGWAGPTSTARRCWPVEVAVQGPGSSTADRTFHGELVQFGRVVPWTTGMPVPHRAAT